MPQALNPPQKWRASALIQTFHHFQVLLGRYKGRILLSSEVLAFSVVF